MSLTGYTRWRADAAGILTADLLGIGHTIRADPARRTVHLNDTDLTPDEARLLGVRLIDAAVLADGERAIREPPPP